MKPKKEQYTVQLEPEFVEKIDKLADKLELSRSQLMRNFLHTAYDDAVMLDKLGLLTAENIGQKLFIKFKEKYLSEKISSDEKND
jgi:hypothetical protein